MSKRLNITSVEKFFRSCHDTLGRRLVLSSILSVFSVLLGFTFLFVLAEQWLFLSPWVKIVLWVLVFAFAVWTGWLVRKKYSIPGFTLFYRNTSDRIGIPAMRHALDLTHSRYKSESGLTQAAVQQNLEQIAGQNTEQKLCEYRDKHPVSRFLKYIYLSFGTTFLLLLAGLFFFGDAFYRSSTFWVSYQRPIPFEYSITPGDTTIEQGSALQVSVRFSGNAPEQVRLGLQSDQENQPRIQGMTRYKDGLYRSRETELFEDVEYHLEMDGYRSELKRVRVELLPRLQELAVTTHPPDYTGLESETYTYPFNRIETPAGSELEIRSRKNKPLEMLQLIAENSGDTLSLSPDTLITSRITAASDERFHFRMRDEHGLTNSNPFRFRLSVIEDQPPFVEILSPESHIYDFLSDTVPLLYEYEDDFGFTSVQLHYRLHKAFVDKPVEGMIPLAVPQRSRGLSEYDWGIGAMRLGPMDRLEYWIEITDNNEYDGYQTTRSAGHVIEIPSLASRIFEQEEKEEQIDQQFSEIETSYQRMQDDMERLREEIRSRPDDEWEHSQLIDEITDQRRDIEKQLEDLRRDFEELTRDMEQQDVMSQETMERYQELKQLIEEIDDPEILRLLEEMQENLGLFDQSQLREQLDKIEFNEERYRERLERTMELFKRLRLNADLENMSELLKDLEQREAALSEQEVFGDQEIQQQEQIQQQMQELSEKMEQLPEKSPLRQQDQIQQMSDEIKEKMDDLDGRLRENIEKMQDEASDPSELRQEQQDMSHDMGEMSQQLSDMRRQMDQETITINMQALRYILETLILLSEEQEDVAKRTSELSANSPGFIEQARRQRNITGQFHMITDSLYRVSTEIPQFSNRINDRKQEIQRHMDRTIDYLIDRNRSRATAQERSSLGGLNEIGTMVADLLDQLGQMDNGNGDGQMSMQQMMEQMQNMSGDQQQLNQQIQDFINDLQGERLTRDHMERLEQMARQQNLIREQMKQLQRRGNLEGDRLMSDMERLAEEMEEAINELRGGSTDRQMVERQENILSRMLEVEESVHKRDEDEEERLGETAEEYDPRDVPEMTMEELREKIRSGVEQTDYTRFRDDYRRLIERYFQLIEEYLEEPGIRSR